MRVAVLGGGFQGCCTAIELACRGAQVILYEKSAALLAGAASANEGKIHLGYVYAADRTLATARTMLRGSLSFAPSMHRYLETKTLPAVSRPYLYAVDRHSQLSVEELAGYYKATSDLALSLPDRDCYFGLDLSSGVRRLDRAELERRFDLSRIEAVFETPEIAVDSIALGVALGKRVASDPRIEVRLGHQVTAVANDGDRLAVRSEGVAADDPAIELFDNVVNATWGGRLAIDVSHGIRPERRWMYRFKHGIRFRTSGGAELPSVTLVLGPYGG